jgi:hypothetical protein
MLLPGKAKVLGDKLVLVLILQGTQCASVDQSVKLDKKKSCFYKNYSEHINAVCGQNAECLVSVLAFQG